MVDALNIGPHAIDDRLTQRLRPHDMNAGMPAARLTDSSDRA